MHGHLVAMRYHDEEDPKKPQPVRAMRKGDNHRESQEHGLRPVGPHGPKHARDHYRHVHAS